MENYTAIGKKKKTQFLNCWVTYILFSIEFEPEDISNNINVGSFFHYIPTTSIVGSLLICACVTWVLECHDLFYLFSLIMMGEELFFFYILVISVFFQKFCFVSAIFWCDYVFVAIVTAANFCEYFINLEDYSFDKCVLSEYLLGLSKFFL